MKTFRDIVEKSIFDPRLTPYLENQIFPRRAVFAKRSALLASINMYNIKQMKTFRENSKKLYFGSDLPPFLGQFSPFSGRNIFFQKSVTFLDLLKANLMQKIRKN